MCKVVGTETKGGWGWPGKIYLWKKRQITEKGGGTTISGGRPQSKSEKTEVVKSNTSKRIGVQTTETVLRETGILRSGKRNWGRGGSTARLKVRVEKVGDGFEKMRAKAIKNFSKKS